MKFFNETFSGNQLNIIIPERYRTDKWSLHFGELQQAIVSKKYKNDDISAICIDMSGCIWMDPLPLLSLIIALFEYKSDNNRIIINLHEFCERNVSDDFNLFLAFMVQEGFMGQFIKMEAEIYFMNNPAPLKDGDHIYKYLSELAFNIGFISRNMLLAEVKDLKEINDGDNNVAAYIVKLFSKMTCQDEKIPNRSLDNVYNKLNHVLYEIIDNVRKHAYLPEREKHFVGIYIRYKEGSNSKATLTNNQKERISKTASEENRTHPKLSSEISENSEGFIEVFIIDSGLGLKENLKDLLEKKYNSIFFGCFQETFFYKLRSPTNGTQGTTYGGLDLISQLLRAENDYIYAHEGNEWIGFVTTERDIEISKHLAKDSDKLYEKTDSDRLVEGLAYIFRISWESEGVRSDQDVSYYHGKNTHPVYSAFQEHDELPNVKQFNECTYWLEQRSDIDIEHTPKIGFSKTYENFIWLPGKKNNKNDILSSLEKYAQIYKLNHYIQNNSNIEYILDYCANNKYWYTDIINKHRDINKSMLENIIDIDDKFDHRLLKETLIVIEKKFGKYKNKSLSTLNIMDIPSHEMVIYKNSLKDAYANRIGTFSAFFNEIVVISSHYEVIALKLNDKDQYCLNKNLADEYISHRMKEMALWLRSYESQYFWRRLSSEKDKDIMFINADVQWTENQIISGYLNLENLFTIPEYFNFIKKIVYRALGFFENKDASFIGSDAVVHQIVEECNVSCAEKKNKHRIHLDSVYTTGHTSSLEEIDDSGLNVALFFHPSSRENNKKNNIADLFLWLDEKLFSPENLPQFNRLKDVYKRVEHTHLIDKDSSYFTIINRKVNEKSSYKQNTENTYADLQKKGLGLIRTGHYQYDGNHSFINYKFHNIIESSFKSKNGVFLFIFKHFFFALLSSIKPSEIKKQIKLLDNNWTNAINEAYDNNEDDWGRAAIIVYPNHHHSSHIIMKIKKLLPTNMSDRIIPINTVIKNSNGFVISPTSIRTIENKMKEYDNPADVIIFDTIIESGRTRKLIKHVLSKIEKIGDIKTLSIIDSSRLPYISPEKSRYRAHWRFDVPRLGTTQACKLCNAINRAKELINEVVIDEDSENSSNVKLSGKEIINRIDEWIQNWECISALDYSSTHGLTEAPIKEIKSSDFLKEFGPSIKTNIGLVVYILEMHNIQLNDDIIFKIIDRLKPDRSDNSDKSGFEQIAFIISSYLIHYGAYASSIFQMKIIKELFIALIELDTPNNYSSFAALILNIQEKQIIEKALLSFLAEKNTTDSKLFSNIDLNIVLSHLAQHSGIIYLALPEEITNMFDHKTRKNAYLSYHYALYNEGGITHTRVLQRFIDKKFLEYDDNNISKVASELQSLLKNIRCINLDEYLAPGSFVLKEYEVLKCDIEKIRNNINIYINTKESKTKKDTGKEISKGVESIHEYLKSAHALLFLPMGKMDENNSIKKKIESLVSKCINELKQNSEGTKTILADGESPFPQTVLKEIWYFWNSDIENELKYLLDNARHSKKPIKSKHNFDADMLFSINYTLNYCEVVMKNIGNKSRDEIIKETIQKNRTEKKRNKELGVDIEIISNITDDGLYEIETKFIIPSAKYNNRSVD